MSEAEMRVVSDHASMLGGGQAGILRSLHPAWTPESTFPFEFLSTGPLHSEASDFFF